MKVYVISDTHLKHENMKTYCQRPPDFTERIHKNIMNTLKPEDMLIHLGDVGIGKYEAWAWMVEAWKASFNTLLVRGNHDRSHSNSWWMKYFHVSVDSFVYRDVLFTHEPANAIIVSDGHKPYKSLEEVGLPLGCTVNVHGHLHNIWDGFHRDERVERDKELLHEDFKHRLKHPWQRLFAVEYTDYRPVELEKFLQHPDKYKARGPKSTDDREPFEGV